MITKLEIDKQLYQQQCDAVVNMINQAKAEYYSVTLATAGAKDMFRIVNGLISHQDKALPSGDSDLVLANRFADFFERKVATIRADLDASSITAPLLSQKATRQLDKFDEVTEAVLTKIIARAPTKSCCLDAIPTWLLKDPAVVRALLPTLASLVNVFLTIGEFPACLKVAVVTPILKKPGLDLNDLTNCRPVSNLQFIGKVLEKVFAEQLTRRLEAHSLHDDLQSAHRPRTQRGDRTTQNKKMAWIWLLIGEMAY